MQINGTLIRKFFLFQVRISLILKIMSIEAHYSTLISLKYIQSFIKTLKEWNGDK